MSRSSIDCVYPDGSSFQATVAEARWIVANDLGEWGEQRVIRMKRQGRSGGRLSLRVGPPLANAVHRGESWARTMLQQIER
jgi:hypothetical protein